MSKLDLSDKSRALTLSKRFHSTGSKTKTIIETAKIFGNFLAGGDYQVNEICLTHAVEDLRGGLYMSASEDLAIRDNVILRAAEYRDYFDE